MITKHTAYVIISRDDIVVDAGCEARSGRWIGWITLGPDDRYRPLLNSEPIYLTREEAIDAMNKVIKELRENVDKI